MVPSATDVISRVSVETNPPGPTAPVRRRRGLHRVGLIVALAAVVSLAAAGGFLAAGPKAKADRGPVVYALLHVAKDPENVLEHKQHKHKISDSDFESYRQTQVALLKSRLVLNAALRNPKVAALALVQDQKDPVEWLEDNLQVDFPQGPEIMRIGLNGPKTDDLKILVDAVTDTYLAEVVHKEDNKRTARLQRLETLHLNFDEILRTKQDTLNNLTRAFAEGGMEAWKNQFNRDELTDFARELRRVRLAKIAAQARLNQQRAAKKKDEHAPVNIRKAVEEVDVLSEQEKLLNVAVEGLVKETRKFSSKSLDIQGLQEEIAQAKEITKKLLSQMEALKIELLAPARIEKLQEAIIRKSR